MNLFYIKFPLLIFFFFFSCIQQYSIADDVEVVKSVSPEETEKRDENNDQVALESVDQEQKVHPPPGHVVQVQGEIFIGYVSDWNAL